MAKTDFFKKEQSYVNISYLLQQHTKLFLNRAYFNNVIQCLLSISKIMNLLGQRQRIAQSWTRIKVQCPDFQYL